MGALATFIWSLLASLVVWLGRVVTQRVAITVAVVSALVALTGAFIAGLNALVGSIAQVMPASVINAANLFLPSNTVACISTVSAAKVAYWIYAWKVRAINARSKVG